ncbi:hypothetical protein N7449_006224 [Penicillium cf. viridicatum]|uniref:Uncharacterized protein n=1 Tax=Penicillium cf. viridicatum TaxID=2972119 RepID=A0A9W9MAX5_9EURO|nr:hypothetical protein N7449_006224 [Penicillium cf. viridicatum]
MGFAVFSNTTPLNTLEMSKKNFDQMLAGLHQDQIRNADKKAKAVEEAHHKATQYLCTLYLTLVDNPFVGFYNPITKNQIPPKAARDAISKLDRINSRLMDRNIANDLYLGLGQIQWQRFVEIWKTTLFVLNNTRQSGEPEIEPLMLALSDMCKEYDYPSTWASLPPSGPAETHANNKIKTE